MVLILLLYGAFKTKLMIEYATVHIQQPNMAAFFEANYSFDQKKYGWNIAFGLTAYDSSSS